MSIYSLYNTASDNFCKCAARKESPKGLVLDVIRVIDERPDPGVRFCVGPAPRLLTTMADETQTDVSRPSALPNARLKPSASQNRPLVDQSSDEYLDAVEEEWNKKVDVEIEALVDGMVDIVNLASVRVLDGLVPARVNTYLD